jgi:twitching motility protein PilT
VSTLHTIDAGQTINRILGMFETEEQEQVRIRLADTLRWVVCQKLAPKVGGGRYALLEIMGNNMRTKESIEKGESEGKTFYEIIEASYTFGWHTFDQAITDAFEKGLITEESAGLYATKRGVVTRKVDNIKKQRGEQTTDVSSLSMKPEEKKTASGPAAPPPVLKLK